MKHLLTGLCAVILLSILLLSGAAGSAQTVFAADPTRDRCRDEFGNEICTHYYEIDGRVNPNDAIARMTAYCRAGRSIDVYSIINSVGEYLFTATEPQITAALSKALGTGRTVLIGAQKGGQLVALASGRLQIQGIEDYVFAFDPLICGIPLPAPNGSAPVIVPQPTNSPENGTGLPLTQPSGGGFDLSKSIPASAYTLIAYQNGQILPLLPANFSPPTLVVNETVFYRSQPVIATETQLGLIWRGRAVTVYARDRSGYWSFVKYGPGYGWIASEYIGFTPETIAPIPVAVFN